MKAGLTDRQQTLSGRSSCGIAAVNFVEFRIGMGFPRWLSAQSTQFSDSFLLYRIYFLRNQGA